MAGEIEIHPGHWKNTGSGANGWINEVVEARKVAKRVFNILKDSKVPATYIEDNISSNQKQNINHLVREHNKDRDALIVSIHFNASGSTANNGIGTEVLYYKEKNLAADIAKAISDVSGLKNRGAKQRTDLGVFAKTYEPAILIEVCFVNDPVDVALYHRDFEKICYAIAEQLAAYLGKTLKEEGLTMEEFKELKEKIEALEKQLAQKVDRISSENAAPWAEEAWNWATKEGLTDGLNPAGVLTRQQQMTILKRYYDKYIAK